MGTCINGKYPFLLILKFYSHQDLSSLEICINLMWSQKHFFPGARQVDVTIQMEK